MAKFVNLTPHPVVILRDDPEGPIVGSTGTDPVRGADGKFIGVRKFARI